MVVMARNIEKQLRDAVRRSDLNMFQLSKQAEVRYASIHRFVVYDQGLTLRSAAKLAELLDLELRPARGKTGSPRKSR